MPPLRVPPSVNPPKRPIPELSTFVDLLFPIAGVDVSGAFGQQRPRTCAVGQNVRAFEPGTNRARGGQRPGIISYINGQVASNFSIQDINALTDTTGVGGIAGTGVLVSTSTANPAVVTTTVAHNLATGQTVTIAGTGDAFVNGTYSITVTGTTTFTIPINGAGHGTTGGTWSIPQTAIWTRTPQDSLQTKNINLNNGGANVFSYASGGGSGSPICSIGTDVFDLAGSPTALLVWEIIQVYPGSFIASGNLPGTQPASTPFIGSTATDGSKFFVISSQDSKASIARITTAGAVDYTNTSTLTVNLGMGNPNACSSSVIASSVIYTVWSSGYITKMSDGSGNAITILVTPANISAAAPGYQIAGSGPVPPWSAITSGVLAVPIWNPATGQGGVALVTVSTGAVVAVTGLANTTQTAAITTDATNFYALFGGPTDSTVVSLTTTGTVNWTTALGSPGQPGVIAYVANTTSLYVSNPLNSYTLNTSGTITGGGIGIGLVAMFDGGTLVPTAPPTPGQDTVFNRNLILLAASNGFLKVAKNGLWNSVTNNSGSGFAALVRVVRSASNNGKMYYVDSQSYKFYDPAKNTLNTWTASQGSLPTDTGGNSARLIATWRGRTVLSGLPNDPYNYFMSAVLDPTNWNYTPAVTLPTQAVQGTNGVQGKPEDVITALIPWTDDLLILGGAHTIHVFTGDPMAGGQIDLVSSSTGIAWGDSWCMDPYGNIYFMSNLTGIYQMAPGALPQRLSQPIENLLSRIVLDDVVVRMAWNDQLQGVHVFLTHTQNARAETHFFWEYRTGAWWTDTFGNNNHNPFCCYSYYGSTVNDRVVLIGSWDGHVRAFQLQAGNDEGTNISSVVVLGPIQPNGLDEFLIKDLQAVLGANSGTVNYSVLIGQTPEQALLSTAVASGTLSSLNGGRNALSFVRRAGYAIYVKLTATNPWALELIRCRLAGRPFTGKVRGRAIQI